MLTSQTITSIWKNQENSLLNCLAEAGLVDNVVAILNGSSSGDRTYEDKLDDDQTDWEGINGNQSDEDQMDSDQRADDDNISGNKVSDTFLHTFAQKHTLGEFFSKIGTNKTLKKMLKPQMLTKNLDGNTFLAVAVKTVSVQQKAGDESGGRMMRKN